MYDDNLTPYRFRCLRCNEQCHATRTDRGIGAYEYWGRQERHEQMDITSICCDADVEEF